MFTGIVGVTLAVSTAFIRKGIHSRALSILAVNASGNLNLSPLHYTKYLLCPSQKSELF